MNDPPAQDEDFALIIREPGKAQQILLRYVVMILSYRYGMTIAIADDLRDGVTMLRKAPTRVRSVFVIQNAQIQSQMALRGFTLMGKVPLVLLVPNALIGMQMRSARGASNVKICAWERAFGKGGPALAGLIDEAFSESGIDGLGDGEPSDAELQQRVETRLK